MLYRKIKYIGTDVSVITLGGNIFGYLANQEKTKQIINKAGDSGINFLDTSDTYSKGISENYIGSALKGSRQKWIIASKCGLNSHESPSGLGTKNSIIQKLDSSLQRLKTDYIDLYQMHHFDPDTPLEETYSTLTDCVKLGKIRTIGVSNYSTDQIIETSDCIKKNNFSPIASAQYNYNILNRNSLDNFFPTCKAHKISVLAYGVLARGILGGGYEKNVPLRDNSRAKISKSINSDLSSEILEITSNLKFKSKELGISLPKLSISWALSNSNVTSAIIGMHNMNHLEDAVAAVKIKISDNNFNNLIEISRCSWNNHR